ncbi:MAG TPA: hypothetical protein DC063_11200 [Arenimonas sp.]|nr:MAG: hypothetical protein A2X76_00750 [Xanthomonadales bacterium GWF1_69_6]HBD20582.1 hypothetical protein [Arenimonas sp.]
MFFGKTSVGVEWSQPGRAHGLLRATLMRPAQGVEAIDLLVDGKAHPVDLSALPAGAATLPVNIHTMLLGDGRHTLELVVRSAQGRQSTGAHDFELANPGALAARVRASLAGRGVPLAYAGPCDAGRYDYDDASLRPWFDREDADAHVQALLDAGRIDAGEAEALRGFVRDGYLLLPGGLDDALVDRALEAMQKAVDEGYQGYRYGDSTRLEQMHNVFPAIRELWLQPRILRMLGLLFDEPAQPCQSLGYVFGSQQDAHQDTIHLTPFPAGYMCGVWMALEDVQPGSGELVVYPGSHRLPRVRMHDSGCAKVEGPDWSGFGATVVRRWGELLEAGGFQPMPYLAKRGSVLIWHENLMHAGSVRRDPSLSRRSVVTHHFARGSLAFYDSTGLAGITHDTGAAA